MSCLKHLNLTCSHSRAPEFVNFCIWIYWNCEALQPPKRTEVTSMMDYRTESSHDFLCSCFPVGGLQTNTGIRGLRGWVAPYLQPISSTENPLCQRAPVFILLPSGEKPSLSEKLGKVVFLAFSYFDLHEWCCCTNGCIGILDWFQ